MSDASAKGASRLSSAQTDEVREAGYAYGVVHRAQARGHIGRQDEQAGTRFEARSQVSGGSFVTGSARDRPSAISSQPSGKTLSFGGLALQNFFASCEEITDKLCIQLLPWAMRVPIDATV